MGQEYYGLIGNGETCALISSHGSIDWFCLPIFDGDLIFAHALDPVSGERLSFHVLEGRKELACSSASHRYRPKTNILVTTLQFRGLCVTLTDLMPWTYRGGERAIVRQVHIKNTTRSSRTIETALMTKKPMGKNRAHRELAHGDILVETPQYAFGLVLPKTKVVLKPNEEKSLSVVFCYEHTRKQLEAVMESWQVRNLDEVMRATTDYWTNWLARGRPIGFSGTDSEVIERGLLCMKLLQYAPSGAFLAAPTASFPAYPGLNDNWDYRFCWIRDSYFAARAMLLTGHFDEVQAILRFLLKLQDKSGHWQQPFYTISGTLPPKEIVLETMRGPNRELNIRINNGARDQLQLDSEGSVLHLLYLYLLFSKDDAFVRAQWKKIVAAADWLVANADLAENGIWEFRERTMQWTYGKALCYAGLESACKIADLLRLEKKKKWVAKKESLKRSIPLAAWSEQRKAFLQTYEDDAPVDISALALEDYGIVTADSQRMEQTVARIGERLTFEGGIRRYESAILPFFLPTVWLAGHYIKVGEHKRARALLDHAIENLSSLYLAAEHYDPRTRTQHGNFPQLFCHSAIVEQLVLFHHKPSLVESLSLLSLPLKKTTELVDELLISPLLKIFR